MNEELIQPLLDNERAETESHDYGELAPLFVGFDRKNAEYGNHEKYLDKYLEEDSELVSLGCGSATLGKRISDRYDVTGVDMSQEMLELADKSIRKVQGDMRDPPLKGDFEGVYLTGFSSIYLNDHDDIENCFSSARELTDRDGIFMFDYYTPETFKNFNGPHRSLAQFGEIIAERKASIEENSESWVRTNDYTLHGDGLEKSYSADHHVSGWSRDFVNQLFEENDFELLEEFGLNSFGKGVSEDDRGILAFARKK